MIKRTRQAKKTADAILVSDLHLADSIPVSRTDDYITAQINKLAFLQSLSNKNNNCPILCAGDIFDRWKASPWLCSMAFMHLPRPFIGIPGQHDLPEHSLKEFPRSALGLLAEVSDPDEFDIITIRAAQRGTQAGETKVVATGIPFGELNKFVLNPEFERSPHYRYILMLHELTWQGKAPSWDKNGLTDLELLDKFGEHFDLILTGDNHAGFVTRQGDSLLVNPGSMMRKTADQEHYIPRCYLYYADDNTVTHVEYPIEKGVHNREHIDRKRERDDRTAAYISNIRQWESGGLSFKKNLEAFFKENKVTQKVRDLILCHLETH